MFEYRNGDRSIRFGFGFGIFVIALVSLLWRREVPLQLVLPPALGSAAVQCLRWFPSRSKPNSEAVTKKPQKPLLNAHRLDVLATLWQIVLSVGYGEPDNCQHIAHAGTGDVSP